MEVKLQDYLTEEGVATPGNTMGAGNPGPEGNGNISEPLTQGQIDRQPKAYSKKQKTKHKMKDLKDFIRESLVNEARQVSVNAYQLEDIVKFASRFNPSDKDADWDTWEFDYDVTDKSLIKKICKVCATIIKKCDYGTTYITGVSLGNISSNIMKQEFDAEPDDVYYFLAADGDNGRLFYIKRPSSSADQRAVDEFMSLFIGAGGWDWDEVHVS